MCTREDTLTQYLGAATVDDVMSHNELTKEVYLTLKFSLSFLKGFKMSVFNVHLKSFFITHFLTANVTDERDALEKNKKNFNLDKACWTFNRLIETGKTRKNFYSATHHLMLDNSRIIQK